MDVYDQNEKRVAQVREGVTLLPGINPEDQPLTLAFESRPGELYYIMVSVLAFKYPWRLRNYGAERVNNTRTKH